MKKKSLILIMSILCMGVLSNCSRKFKMPQESLSRDSNWKFYRTNINSTGSISGKFNGKLGVIWEQDTDTKPTGPLTLSKGYVVFPGARKKIRLYDAPTGDYSGYVRTKGHSSTGMIISDSLGYFVSGPRNCVLHCTNLLNRNSVWTRPVKDATSGSIIVNDKLILSLTDGTVLAFDLMTGDKKWSFETEERLLAPPSSSDGFVYQPSDKGTVFVLDANDGREINKIEMTGAFITAAAHEKFAFIVNMDGNISALDEKSDSIIWTNKVTGPIWSSPAVSDGRVFVASNTGELNVFNSLTGDKIWSYAAGEVIKSSPIVVSDYVMFGTMSGKLYLLNVSDGALISEREFSGAISQSPASDGRFIYVATDAGELFCLGDTNEVAALHK